MGACRQKKLKDKYKDLYMSPNIDKADEEYLGWCLLDEVFWVLVGQKKLKKSTRTPTCCLADMA